MKSFAKEEEENIAIFLSLFAKYRAFEIEYC